MYNIINDIFVVY